MSSKSNSTHPVAFIYRLTFNYLEPMLAFGGVIQLYFFPSAYLKIATPQLASYLSLTAFELNGILQTLYTQIVGGWLILIFNDLVTLRVFERDVQVWRCVMMAHLLSDLTFCWALSLDWGDMMLNPGQWRADDWLTVLTTLPPLILKISFLMGLGVDSRFSERNKVARKEL